MDKVIAKLKVCALLEALHMVSRDIHTGLLMSGFELRCSFSIRAASSLIRCFHRLNRIVFLSY